MKNKWLAVFLVTAGLTYCLLGCQNKVDIEDRDYVMSLGIELTEEGEKEKIGKTEEVEKKTENRESEEEGKKYQFLYETADLTKTSDEGGGRQQGKVQSVEALSLDEAEIKQQKTDDKRIDYGHLKAILLKESLWNEENVDKIAEELEQKREIAGTTLVFLTEESPDRYGEIAKERGSSLGEYLERMMAKHGETEEYTLADLLREWREDSLWSTAGENMDSKKQIPYLKIQQEEIYLSYWNRKADGAMSLENLSQGGNDAISLKNLSLEKRDNISLGNSSQEAVSKEVLRFHIRANSDSEEDQKIKVRIKDRILPYLQQIFKDCSSKEECMRQAESKMAEIQTVAKAACTEEKQPNLEPKVYLCQESFPVKEYGDILLPSGRYDALRIDLGEAQGKNWWCMMYPSLCMVEGVVEGVDQESKERLREGLTEEEYQALFFRQNTGAEEEKMETEVHFHVKWKLLEKISKFFP